MTWLRVVLTLVVSGVVLVPTMSGALPNHPSHPAQEHDPGDGDDSGQSAGGRIPIDIEVDRADEVDIENAFSSVSDNVRAEQARLDAAEGAVRQADLAVTAAEGAVTKIQGQIDALVGRSDSVVVRTFVNPPAERAVEALTADSVEASTVKEALLQMQADADAAVLDELHGLESKLEKQREKVEQKRKAASRRRSDAEAALADLEDAASQQITFSREIEKRLERNLTEIEMLKETDPELAAQLQKQVDTLAAQLTDARERLERDDRLKELDIDPPTVEGPSQIDIDALEGSILTVSCPSGGSIRVHKTIADKVRDMLNLAYQQGLKLCGNGYRSISAQIALRRAHCPDVWSSPASACSPPTAPPGSSMHEKGLAIDFTCGSYGSVGRGDPCFVFLANNASKFGLHNLPSEPWHWSSDGT